MLKSRSAAMNAHSAIPNDRWSQVWALGYRTLLPIAPPGSTLSPTAKTRINPEKLGKVPGQRLADGWAGLPEWQTIYPTERQIEAWRDQGAGIAIRCENGLVGIDADILNEDLSEVVAAEVTRRLGKLPQRVGQWPKRMFFCKTDPGYYHGKIFSDGGEVEIRTSGQFVIHGIHPDTLKPYAWVGGDIPELSKLPYFAPAELDALCEALREKLPNGRTSRGGDLSEDPPPETLRGGIDRVRRALGLIPNDRRDRDTYINVLIAAKASAPEDVEGVWSLAWAWCQEWKCGDNDEDVVRRDFDSLNPRRLGIGYLEDLANRRSGNRLLAEGFHEDVSTSIFPDDPPVAAPTPLSLLGSVYSPSATPIPPRQFLYGRHYLRHYVSTTIAPTKVGKTSLSIVEALAMASGKPLLGVRPTGLWRVRLWNGEDPAEELDRRIAAAMQEYGLTMEDIGDRLLRDSGRDMPICLATQGKDGTKIWRPVLGALESAIEAQRLDVLGVDPFVKSHGVSENDNMAVDMVVREWNGLAGRRGVAIDLVHHSRKMNGGEASIDDARGASSLVSAARSARVLARMTKKEGSRLGKHKDYRRYFRFADAVSNMAVSAGEDEAWMELKSVDLHNAVFDADGKMLWPSDQVGVVKISGVKVASEDADGGEGSAEAERDALASLASGEWREDVQSRGAWAGVVVAQAYGLDLEDLDDKIRVKAILKSLVKNGKLIVEMRRDGTTRKEKMFVKTAVQDVLAKDNDLFG